MGLWRVSVGPAAGVPSGKWSEAVTSRSRSPATEPDLGGGEPLAGGGEYAAGQGARGKKKGARPTPRMQVLAGPRCRRWRVYSVCSKRNACALSDPLPAAVVMVRKARAVLASLAVRAPRTGTTWSRYSVTAL